MGILKGLKEFGLKPKTMPITSGDGHGTKCENCAELLMKKTLDDNLGVCPHCDYHHKVSARRRIEITLDENSFEERYSNIISKDPLKFKALKTYDEKINRYRKLTGEPDALVCGVGAIEGRKVAIAASDGFFAQGSMGAVMGEKIVRVIEDAIKERLPVIIVSGTGGGARMEEGLFSLMQMTKTCTALGKLHDAKLPFISICTKLTMAGVWASWAAIGDIIIAEPKAIIGFTGARVIEQTIHQELPEGFQTSEFLLEHGQIDKIVHRRGMHSAIDKILEYLCEPIATQ